MTTHLTNFRLWNQTSADPAANELFVRNGVFVSPEAGAEKLDLAGKYLLPKFIDAHCHIYPSGRHLRSLNLHGCESREEVLDRVRDRLLEQDAGWILAIQYDQTRFVDGQHLHRKDLDPLSQDRPILLRHSNGHASVANTAMLQAAGISEDEPNPSGGEFLRDEHGLTGVALETAHELLWHATPNPTLVEMVDGILAAGEEMATFGIGSASDMMTGIEGLERELEAYRLASERGCKVRMRLYVQWKNVFGPRGVGVERFQELTQQFTDPDRCRVAGIKLFADGAIGSATAAIYGQYTGVKADGPRISRRPTLNEPDVSGQLIYSPEKLKEMTKVASDAGYQVAIHAIGDYATDLVLDAFEATGVPERHRIEHAMILSDAQIERMARLNPFCTFQPEFLYRFGHAYLRQLGPARTAKLKRARSVLDAGIRLSFNSDKPIVVGDPRVGIRTATERPEGFDPVENVTLNEALRAYTVAGAEVNGDTNIGELKVGHLADYQLVDQPLADFIWAKDAV